MQASLNLTLSKTLQIGFFRTRPKSEPLSFTFHCVYVSNEGSVKNA